ncbi:hypothetical protein [Helicobacter canis]|uniref:hypothetical protein n=1 Tax=Helicobacter canis TaxID=29419 RepID=UPI000E0E0CE3|nr:hypothetical protein [Helicobacter canis]
MMIIKVFFTQNLFTSKSVLLQKPILLQHDSRDCGRAFGVFWGFLKKLRFACFQAAQGDKARVSIA